MGDLGTRALIEVLLLHRRMPADAIIAGIGSLRDESGGSRPFGVILVTLLVQGLTLPAVLHWARLPDDGAEAAREQLHAERSAAEAGLAALPATATRLGIPPSVADRVRTDHEVHLHSLDNLDNAVPEPNKHDDYHLLRAALLHHKRAAIIHLRDTRRIDDIVLRRVQARLDAEEMQLSPPPAIETE